MDPLSDGRSCYKQKDYSGALKAFTEAVKISTDFLLLTALDHRAATFEKLGQLQPALRDAKEMIDLKPGLAKGYLRCAKVLQLKGEESLALKIYERGLKKVKIGDDPNRPLLQQMFHKLQQRQEPSKNFDPLVMLPTELAQMVCENLDMRDRVICLAVSKPWKRFLEASHNLWTTLDLRHLQRSPCLESLKAHFRRSNYTLDRAILDSLFFSGPKLKYLTRTCKQLNYLEFFRYSWVADSLLAALPKAENLRTLILKGEIPLLSLVKVLHDCPPQLEVAEFHKIEYGSLPIRPKWPQLNSLTSLRLTSPGRLDLLNLDNLVLRTPNLRFLSILRGRSYGRSGFRNDFIDFAKWSKLEYLDLTGHQLFAMPRLPPTLKYLDISDWGVSHPPIFSDEIMDMISNSMKLPELETFRCHDNGSFDLRAIFKLIEPTIEMGNLKTLHIGHQLDNDEDHLRLLVEHSIPSVEDLSLFAWQISEEKLLMVLRKFPALQRLDLSYTKVTGVAVKELMTRETGPLIWLGLRGCGKISPDAVEYARRLGAVVEYNFPENSRRSKSFHDKLYATGL